MSDFLAKLGDLKGHIEKSLETWNVPGVAVSIVKDGETILAEGFGYKDVENKKPMTANTVLPIGSASKSFTSMAAAILVEEGKMEWDTPINQYIPAFQMFDPVASAHISVRDMLCHRGGMPRHDLMWAVSKHDSFTREDLIRRVRYLENNAQFREKAQYQNHMFATVGYAIEKVSGKTWEEFVKERIMDPIGMKNSNFSTADSQKMPDYALPYRHDKDKNIKPATFMELGAPGPAGSINSTVLDMAEWMKLVLNKGTHGDTKIVGEDKVKEMHRPHMIHTIMPWEFPEMLFPSLGLGWFTEAYRGHKIVHHGGNVTGFTALCALLPEENMGICLLVNLNGCFMTYALRNEVYDRVLGYTGGDWNTRYMAEVDKLMGQMQEGKDAMAKARVEGTKPSLALEAYCGEYEHPGYGVVKVERANADGGFDMNFNGRALQLRHYHYDQFNLWLETYEMELPGRFTIGSKGDVESFGLMFEGAIGKYIVFNRKPEEKPEEK